MTIQKTIKGAFTFPRYGGGRYIPNAELVSGTSVIRWDTAFVKAGKSYTAKLVTGDYTYTTSADRTVIYPYRLVNLTIATESNVGQTMRNVSDFQTLFQYGQKLARLETVYTQDDGTKSLISWGTDFIATKTDFSLLNTGTMRITINCDRNEQRDWLAYAIYVTEITQLGMTAGGFRYADDWSAIETSGLII